MVADLEAYLILKSEIEQIGRDMRSGGSSKVVLGLRIAKALDRMESLLKSEAYLTMAKDQEPAVQSEPELPSKVLAKRAGVPGTCPHCGQDDCVCFAHLPKPRITIRPDKMVKIEFSGEYTDSDKLAWLKGMQLALVKRREKNNE